MALRRPHKKSKLGCLQCKRRHVKCDEGRPTCANCLATCRTCTYQPPPPRTIQSSSIPLTLLPLPAAAESADTISPPSSHVTSRVSVPSTPSSITASVACRNPVGTLSKQYNGLCHSVNMRHMELFSHFIFDTGPSLGARWTRDREFQRTLMPVAISTPYLMHQILALSALHLSHTTPDQRTYCLEEATALQTQALLLFNNTPAEITAENCVPMLIFSSFLGLHALAESVISSETDADDFLDRFVTYLNLHRGVRAVTQQSWALLMRSDLSPILNCAESSLDNAPLDLQERAAIITDSLNSLIEHADMDTDSETACRDAISRLRLLYQTELSAEELSHEDQPPVGLIWMWPILLSGSFTHLLMKRKPEALIILCHYAVFLHQHRGIWLVRNAGRMLIEWSTRFLGTYWRQWLDWPNRKLDEPLFY